MESMPENSSGAAGKRTRAKAKAAKSPADAGAAVKKARAPRKAATNEPPDAPTPATAIQSVVPNIDEMIATAAYYMAAARNFTPGYELDDWLAAERTIRARLHS